MIGAIPTELLQTEVVTQERCCAPRAAIAILYYHELNVIRLPLTSFHSGTSSTFTFDLHSTPALAVMSMDTPQR